jgi:deazaflavin-dependent oxidoreductase (nitroreductase family)
VPQAVFKLFDVHVFWYRLTGGLVGSRIGSRRMLLLDHIGAKSGKRYTTPLLYGEDGDNLVLVASKGGAVRDPAWYGNLMAHPDTTVQVGRQRRRVRARTASAEEKPRLWATMLEHWPGYDGYQKKTDREIPVVVLEPR